jgi:uncharacterized repeat protein (TIGR03847 family)
MSEPVILSLKGRVSMPDEILLDPADFVTVGTVGPKGRRVFYIQGGGGSQIVTLTIEKQQAQALSDAITEMLDALKERYPDLPDVEVNLSRWDMSLHDPIEPLFRVSQMGLGYDEERDLIQLVMQELVVSEDEEEGEPTLEPQPQVVRMWATREQVRALSEYAQTVVKKGRADPKTNGYMIYYWT